MLKDFIRDGKVINITLEDGREAKVSAKFIDTMMENLDIDEEDAILTWLEDEEYIINEDQQELNDKAKDNKVLASLHRVKGDIKKKNETATPKRTVKENPTKEMIIAEMAKAVAALDGVSDLVIENKGKIITFSLNGENYKIDLVQKRKAKADN